MFCLRLFCPENKSYVINKGISTPTSPNGDFKSKPTTPADLNGARSKAKPILPVVDAEPSKVKLTPKKDDVDSNKSNNTKEEEPKLEIKTATIEQIENDEAIVIKQENIVENITRRSTSEDGDEVTRRGGFRGNQVDVEEEIVKYPKSAEEEKLIKDAIEKNDFLKNILKEDQLQSVIDAMSAREVKPKELIIQQGSDGDDMFVSQTGKYEIIINGELHDMFSDHRIFGELAILYNNPRLATIKALTSGRIWTIKGNIYQRIMVQNAMADRKEILSFLRNVPAVNKASDQKLQQIANLLKTEFFTTDTVIIKQGDKGDKFYIIKAGSATVSVNDKGKVATLSRGQCFGERALLQEDCRQATVTADSPGVECLYLSRGDFIDYLGDLESFVKKEEAIIEETIVSEYDNIELSDLKRVETLGVGGFGRVELVQCTKDKSLVFALKYLKKCNMIEKGQREHAFNEKNIQMSCKSIFIARLYNTFQDNKYLYYLMESCLGGDLWTLAQKQKGRCFDEENSRFLAACVLEAIAYLHERNYIFRDLKPENMLIDSHGYVKLTDFGFARRLLDGNKTFTFAGTPEYVAPEIVYNRGHDKAVDYWAFGIFIYELLVGRTPFKTKDYSHVKTYSLILKGIDSVAFPSRMPKQAQLLIKKLCRTIPSDRLGCQKNGAQDIRNQKWFINYDWNKLRNRKIKPSFVPKLNDKIDTRYFQTFDEDLEIPDDHELWEGF